MGVVDINIKLKNEISRVRSFNRYYTNVLGLIDQHILKSEFSLSEVRVLHEIEKTENCTSKLLSDTLSMDAGYLSRIIKKFEGYGFLRREKSSSDGRAYNLYITDLGRERMTELNNASSMQIAGLLKPLSELDREFLVGHMAAIEGLLTQGTGIKLGDVSIRADIRPGDIGYITYMHGWIYAEEYGYPPEFEGFVAESLYRFIQSFWPGRDRLWCAEHDGRIVGCVGVASRGERAEFRWLLTDPHYRGIGLGGRLLREAIAFARAAGYKTLCLDAASDLDAALAMFRKAGFTKRGERSNGTWRNGLTEVEMEMKLCGEELK